MAPFNQWYYVDARVRLMHAYSMRLALMRGRRQRASRAWAGQDAADTEDRQLGSSTDV